VTEGRDRDRHGRHADRHGRGPGTQGRESGGPVLAEVAENKRAVDVRAASVARRPASVAQRAEKMALRDASEALPVASVAGPTHGDAEIMAVSGYRAIRGTFVARGYAPDGDSVRFAADRFAELDLLRGASRLDVANDTTVQVRLEGIDAPELHYLARAQRLADRARDTLMRALGIAFFRVEHDYVREGDHARGTIVARGVDGHGRVIAYAFRDEAPLDVARSVNATMLREGLAYPLAYDTQPDEHRAVFVRLARDAGRAARGVWALDRTREFALASAGSIGTRGALIFPKLFRRCVAFLTDRVSGFRGGIGAWLQSEAGPANDVVIVAGRLRRLHELVAHAEHGVTTTIEPTRVVFVAR